MLFCQYISTTHSCVTVENHKNFQITRKVKDYLMLMLYSGMYK